MREKDVFPNRRNRSIFEQLCVILEACNEPANVSKLFYRLEGSYTQYKKLVSEALRLNLIQKADSGYIITHKGVEFISLWQKILNYLKGEENESS